MYLKEHFPFELKPLDYRYNALEPYIDEQTLVIHYQGHYKNYVDKLNKTLTPYPAFHNWNIDQLLFNIKEIPERIRHDVWVNAGGVNNHQIYFETMSPNPKPSSNQSFNIAIQKSFIDLNNFQKKFKEYALGLVGSGYTWLVTTATGEVAIINTANQDTTIPYNLCPILGIDLWEHAYYLKYKNNKEAYIDVWFKLVDWDKVAQNYCDCLKVIQQEEQ